MPSSWITALKQWNNQDTELHAPHKDLWTIPKKNTKSMEEVRAFMPRGEPGAAVIRHGSRKPTLAAQLNAEILTKLRAVEKETAERNAQRAAEAKKRAEAEAKKRAEAEPEKPKEAPKPKEEPKEDRKFISTYNISRRRGTYVDITKSDMEKIEKMGDDAKKASKEAKTTEEKSKIITKYNNDIKKLINDIEARNKKWKEEAEKAKPTPAPASVVKSTGSLMSLDKSMDFLTKLGGKPREPGTEAEIISFGDLTSSKNAMHYLAKLSGKKPTEQPKAVAEAAKELIAETKEPLTKVGDYSYNATFFNDLDEIFDPANSKLSTKKVQELRKKIGTDVYDSFANFARYSDLYPTPLPEVRRIVSDMMRHLTDKEKKDGISVLEPSAGTGNILRGVIDAQKDGLKINRIDACEFQLGLYNLLKANFKISHIENDDFLEFKPNHHYDVVIMNPPFSGMVGDKDVKNLYTYHLFRAMAMKPRLIFSVMPRYDPKDAVTKYITSKYGPVPKYKVEQTMTINTFVDFKSGVPKPLKITAQVFRLEEE